jgi:hypothetical protein
MLRGSEDNVMQPPVIGITGQAIGFGGIPGARLGRAELA